MKYKVLRLIAFLAFVFCVLPFFSVSCDGTIGHISALDIASGMTIDYIEFAPERWVYTIPVTLASVFLLSIIPIWRRFFNIVQILICSIGIGAMGAVIYTRFNSEKVAELETRLAETIQIGYAFWIVLVAYVIIIVLCVFWKDAIPEKKKKK